MGLGTAPDIGRAAQLFQAAADKGSALGQNRLGLMYLDGQGVIRDYKTGAKLVCDAAAAGEENGAFNCGVVLMEGRGTDKDPARALTLWEQAADKGHIAATKPSGAEPQIGGIHRSRSGARLRAVLEDRRAGQCDGPL